MAKAKTKKAPAKKAKAKKKMAKSSARKGKDVSADGQILMQDGNGEPFVDRIPELDELLKQDFDMRRKQSDIKSRRNQLEEELIPQCLESNDVNSYSVDYRGTRITVSSKADIVQNHDPIAISFRKITDPDE